MRPLTSIILTLFFTTTVIAQQDIAYLSSALRTASERSNTTEVAVLPFELIRGMMHVQATVDDENGHFILDTGAPGLVLNELPDVSESPYVGTSCSGEVAVGVRAIDEFQWAAGRLVNLEALTVDLSHLEKNSQRLVRGMIGYQVLRRFVVVLDYHREEILLTKRKLWKRQDVSSALAVLPFELVDHLPVVTVHTSDGQILRLGIDTGAAANILDNSVALTTEQNQSSTNPFEIQGLDQQIQRVSDIQIDQLNIGAVDYSGSFLQMNFAATEEEALHGLLGYPFLSQYVVAIDYHNKELLLWQKE